MTSETTLPLQPEQLDELDSILDELRSRHDEVPQWEFCDGFLTALVCCRRFISATEYLPVLLGDDVDSSSAFAPFADQAQFERFSDLWLRRFAEVTQALDADVKQLDDERAFHPDVMDMRANVAALSEAERADIGDAPIPSFGQIWAIGFMYAVESWPDEWVAPKVPAAAKVLDSGLQCIVTLTEDDTEPSTLSPFEEEGVATVSEQRLDAFADAIWALYDLRALWRSIGPRVMTVQVAEKTGRNDPCPCGSGKKYKKCCGA